MAVVATDNFNRANGGLGANWTTNGGYTAPSIVSNAVPSVNAVDLGATYSAANAGQDDMYAKLDSTVVNLNTGNDIMVWVRMPNDATDTGYEVNAPRYGTDVGGRLWEVFRASSGVYTSLAVSGTGTQLGTGTRSLEIRAVGSTITALQDGVTLASVTDSTHSGSTKRYAGIHLYSEAASGCSLDNFEMGTVVSAATFGKAIVHSTAIGRAASR